MTEAAGDARDERVLVVDDEPANVLLLRKILERSGFDVEGLSDPRQALDVFATYRPDIVLLDLNMPFRDGFEVMAELREWKASEESPLGDEFVPLVVLTADPLPQSRARALAEGAHDFLTKPFHNAEVVQRVRNLLELRQMHLRQREYGTGLAREVERQTAVLTEERQFMWAMLDTLEAGILACDAGGAPRLVNSAVPRFGIRPEDLGPLAPPTPRGLFHPDGLTPLTPEEDPLTRALHGETITGLEVRTRHESGREHVLLVNARPITSSSTPPLARDPRLNGSGPAAASRSVSEARTDGGSGGSQQLGAVVAFHEITDRRDMEEELRRLALHDALTGLPNRALLLDRLAQALARAQRSQRPLAVLFADLDDFKAINDWLGHSAGDQVLTTVAERLASLLRDPDTAARFGGDEFVIICEDLDKAADAELIASRLRLRLREPVEIDDQVMSLQVSIGITVAEDGARDAAELLRDADAAMLLAKRRGGGRQEVFVPALRDDLLQRLDIEVALRKALQEDELELHFQPTIDLRSGTVDGAEALLRWKRGGAWIPTEQFIRVAERSGLIIEIGEWVLRTACGTVAAWERSGDLSERFVLAVNVAARQLSTAGFVELVEEVLRDSGVPARRLRLEITETALMDDPEAAVRTLGALRDLGVSLAVDDFGTGQSSLTYLRRFPIEVVKVDRSFVGGLPLDPADTAIVTTVVDLSRRLGLVTVAEGVETAEQAHLLGELGCELAQGYYYSAAMPRAALPAWITARSLGPRTHG